MAWSSLIALVIGATSLLVGSVRAQDAAKLGEIARERAAATTVEVKPGEFKDRERVESLAKRGLERARIEKERRAKVLEANRAKSQSKPATGPKAAESPVAAGRLIVALSSSMPEEMLREYMRQLDDVPESIVVLRGFIGGAHTVADTGRWVERIRRKEPGCRECAHYQVEVVVDPIAYRMLGIDKVPAVAFVPGIQDLRHCDAETLKAAGLVYGATSLRAALQRMKERGVEVPGTLAKRLGAS